MNATAKIQHVGVGIDTARHGHRVTFLREDRQPAAAPLTVTENRQGYRKLEEQLTQLHVKHPEARFHVHIDAAGQYALNLECFLRQLQLPLVISIGEPKRNRDYHKAFFPKCTTDDTESRAMARFGVIEQPAESLPVPDDIYVLREIAGRLQAHVRDTTRGVNRLHNLLARVFPELGSLVDNVSAAFVLTLLKKYPVPARIAAARLSSLQEIPYLREELASKIHEAAKQSVGSLRGPQVEELVSHQVRSLMQGLREQKELEKQLLSAFRGLSPSGHIQVETIPGIGPMTAAVLVSKIIRIERFAAPENLVGYFGVFPELNTSGVDRAGKPVLPGTQKMSAKGCDLVRRYLWNAAKSAVRHNPAVRELYARLVANGSRGDVALGHCMRKLLHQVFAVWSSNQPFDEQLARGSKSAPLTTGDSVAPPAPQATEKAAGHTRGASPRPETVVTTAPVSVEASVSTVKLQPASVDYAFLREQVTMQQVLAHIGHLQLLRGSGTQRRGPCPLHGSTGSGKDRTFSVNLSKNVFKCFHPGCHQGNVLDFWQPYRGLPLYEAALDLAETFRVATQPTRIREEEPVTCAVH